MSSTTHLNARLDRYAIAAKGQVVPGRPMTQIAGYAAAAGAGLAMTGAADAGIIYSGVVNQMVSINPAAQATTSGLLQLSTAPIDMDGGGADVILGAFNGALIGGPGSAKYLGYASAAGTGGASLLGTGGIDASNLASGAPIGPGGTFAASAGGREFGEFFSGGILANTTSAGNFAFGTTGFVGIRLGSGNFGWIRLRLDDLGPNQPFTTLLAGVPAPPIGSGLNYPDKVTVVDWAYETSGRAIRAGDVPEPTPLALLAAGAAGIGAFRRRKAAAHPKKAKQG